MTNFFFHDFQKFQYYENQAKRGLEAHLSKLSSISSKQT